MSDAVPDPPRTPQSAGAGSDDPGHPPAAGCPTPAGGRPSAEEGGADLARFGVPGLPLRRNTFLTGLTGGLGLLLAYAVFLAIRDAASILVLVFIAIFLAIGLNPAVVRLHRSGLPRGLAVAVVSLAIVLLLCGGLFALVPPLVRQTEEFVAQLPTYLDDLRRNEAISDLVERYRIIERIQAAVNAENIGRALGGVFGGALLIFNAIFNVLTVLVLTIYFMAAFDRMRGAAYSLVPASRRERVRLIGDEILTKFGAYLVGALFIALLAGTATFVFALVAGLPYPFALAVVVAVCDLIPQIGATLGAVIVSVVAFAAALPAGIACVAFFLIYQQIENYLVYPKVMRRSVKVSDVSALVAALLGVALLGLVGALVAVPAVAAIQLIMREVVLPRQQQR